MAFASQEDVFSVIEQVLPPVFEKYGVYDQHLQNHPALSPAGCPLLPFCPPGIWRCRPRVRNHDPEIMVKAFQIVGLGEEDVKAKFPAMYNAFCYGAPPHAGIAHIIICLQTAPHENIKLSYNKSRKVSSNRFVYFQGCFSSFGILISICTSLSCLASTSAGAPIMISCACLFSEDSGSTQKDAWHESGRTFQTGML